MNTSVIKTAESNQKVPPIHLPPSLPTNTYGEIKTSQETSSNSHTLMPDMIFTENPLVIPTVKSNINLELKNMFCVSEPTLNRGNAFRIFALLKLPEELFPDGYRNAYNEIERWVPIYRSSGTNSRHKGRWHLYYCAVAALRWPVNKLLRDFIKYTLDDKKSHNTPESKDKEWMETLNINSLSLSGWMMKCKMRGSFGTPGSLGSSIKVNKLHDKEKKKIRKNI